MQVLAAYQAWSDWLTMSVQPPVLLRLAVGVRVTVLPVSDPGMAVVLYVVGSMGYHVMAGPGPARLMTAVRRRSGRIGTGGRRGRPLRIGKYLSMTYL